jgi:ABC-type sugar transport system ATPase subunit
MRDSETLQEVPSLDLRALALDHDPAKLGPISFTLSHAGCWWLAGASGAGKSLLMESLAGFHHKARGSVRVNGKEISHCSPERRAISLMPQRWKLFPHWTVARNLSFAAKLGGANPDRIAQLTQRLQVRDLLNRPPRALSGGETQRIALIQTLLSPAKILLLDEPLSAIDAALQAAVLDLLEDETAAQRRICLIAAHRPIHGFPLRGTFLIDKGRLLDRTELE